MKKILTICGVIGLFWVLSGAAVEAASYTLIDDNSAVSVVSDSQAGMSNWIVDGTNHLTKQWFWFSVEGDTRERSIDTLRIDAEGTSDTNFDGDDETLYVRYAAANFELETTYILDGGAIGSGVAGIAEIITITNTTASPLGFHLFQYADFDLLGTPNDDTVTFVNANLVRQTDGGGVYLSETVSVRTADHQEAAILPSTLNHLNDLSVSTLDDSISAGPGNATWAWQWDFVIPPGGTVHVSKHKQIVPEPATLAILGFGLITFLRRRKH